MLEVTTHPGVTGTVELLAMITDPRVSFKCMNEVPKAQQQNWQVVITFDLTFTFLFKSTVFCLVWCRFVNFHTLYL